MNGRTNSHGSTIDDLQVPLDPCTNFRAEAGNGSVTLYWDDPVDKYATPEGETAQDPQQLVSVWDHTIVVRKVGSQPANPNDGIVVTSSGVRDQYLTTGYTDASLTNDTTYYYGAFAINEDGVASDGDFTSATPIAGTPLAELAEGTLIKIQENGAPVEFYLAKHNYEPSLNGEGRELLVRKDCYDRRSWNTENINMWEYSSMLSWLNSSYKALFSANVQEQMGLTKYRFNVGSGNDSATNHADAVFILSMREFGLDMIETSYDGSSQLPIASILSVANLNGSSTNQWTRTARNDNFSVVYVATDGSVRTNRCSYAYGCRPVFTLPSTVMIDPNLNLIES